MLAPVEVIEDPTSYAICFGVGLAISALAWWRRPPQSVRAALFILGQTIFLTAPLFAHLDTYVYGSFPTIDKEGSLLFFLDGVHRRMFLHPWQSLGDPAARLIGVHVGHLWVTELFDLVLTPFGAFNLQGLLYPALGWWAAWLFLREITGDARGALVLGFPFGMGLHVFRDLNWYTIEKAAIFWLVLFCWALLLAWRDGGAWRWISAVLFLLMSWMNLYLALVGGAVLALTLISNGWQHLRTRRHGDPDTSRKRLGRVVSTAAAAVVFTLPLILWQWGLMQGNMSLGDPDAFLWKRAALDGFTLWPPAWNRLEVHRSLNVIALGFGMVGAVLRFRDARVRFALFVGAVLFVLSIGPVLLPGPVMNPLYMAVRTVVPGFWRVAKPEVFFHGTWLAILAVAAIQLARAKLDRRGTLALYAVFAAAWVVMVRTHPAYPPMTMPAESRLAPGWEQRVFR